MKNILKYFKPYKKQLWAMWLFVGIATVADLFLPMIMGLIVDNGINAKNVEYIIKQCIVMVVVAIVGLVSMLLTIRVRSQIMTRFAADIRAGVFNKINSMSYSQFNKLGAGALITRSTEDTWMLYEAFGQISGVVVQFPILFVGGLALSFMKDPLMALIMLIFAPIIVVAIYLVGRKLPPKWDMAGKYTDLQNNLLRQRLSGIRVIRAFNQEELEHSKLAKATDEMAANIINANTTAGLINPVAMLIFNFAILTILYVSALRIDSGAMLLSGDIMAIVQYIILMLNSVVIAGFALIFAPRITITCKRINEVLQLPNLALEESLDDIGKVEGNIRFDNVAFSYEKAEQPVLENINIQISNGQTAAFIGGTGSGKSTIVQMLLGFYSPTAGEIYLDNVSYEKCSRKSIRNNISVAQQKSSIFMGTIKENILIGDKDATMEQVQKVCDIAQISTFIEGLDNKYDFVLEQNGSNLSGGQKQRINIARAIIKDCSVYVFDDSFSALDFLTESKLRKRLNKYLKGKTQLVITQRVATAMSADIIYVLDRGRIVGSGTHMQLLKNCEIYREIYISQTGGALDV